MLPGHLPRGHRTGNRLVAQLARIVRADYPEIVLSLDSQTFAQPGLQKLLSGEADLVLGRWDDLPVTVRHDLVRRDSLMLAVADTHPLADAQSVKARDLLGEAFVSLPDHPGAVLPDRLRSLLSQAGSSPEIIQVAPDTETALALVSAAVGVTLTLESVAAASGQPHLRFVPIAEPVAPVDLRVASRGLEKSPAVVLVRGLALRLGQSSH
jgi:DNA-binding transcriptional LysR family regulator